MNITKILKDHKLWLNNPSVGTRADFSGANLRNIDFHNADLRYADFNSADFHYADLSGADLRGANFSGANLDYSCLPLHCGGQFKADTRVCKQLMAHTIRIMKLSNEPIPDGCKEYVKGWHREEEF